MSEAKFTKGPWYVPNDSDEPSWSTPLQVVSSSMKRGIVVMQEDDGEADGEDKANARLIAAAPEMYELLDEVSHILSHELNTVNRLYIKCIEQLLAKARGE